MPETELFDMGDVGSDNIYWDAVATLNTESSMGVGIGEGRGFNKCGRNREDISGRATGSIVGEMSGDGAHRGWRSGAEGRLEQSEGGVVGSNGRGDIGIYGWEVVGDGDKRAGRWRHSHERGLEGWYGIGRGNCDGWDYWAG